MPHLTLNCPTCRKWLTYVPLDGLRLHYRCEEHGLLIFTPLVVVRADDPTAPLAACENAQLHTHDAA